MALADGLAFVPPAFPGAGSGAELMVMTLEGSAAERPPFPGVPVVPDALA